MATGDSGGGRALEEFQHAESLRIALAQAGAQGQAGPGAPRRDDQMEDAASAALCPPRQEEIAAAVGIAQTNELWQMLASRLRVESDEEADETHASEDLSESARRAVRRRQRAPSKAREVERVAEDDGAAADAEDEAATLGQSVQKLPGDLLEEVLFFLDEDSLDMCKVCNRAWREVLCSERLWRVFCDRVFVPPAFRPMRCIGEGPERRPKRFMGSWMVARAKRPRVRTETGVYVLKTTYIKNTGPRSMWTTDFAPFCEVAQYRYLLFKPNGECLYASTPLDFSHMRSRFRRRLFQDYVEEGKCRSEFEVEPAARRRRRRRFDPRKESLDTTKADTIFRGFYTLVNGKLTVVINLVSFSVTFTMETVRRGPAHDRLHTLSHSSVYHKEGQDVQQYKLSPNYFERLWDYYSFACPLEP